MRKILLITPITEKRFNDSIKKYVEKIKSPVTEIDLKTIKRGPSSIESFYAEAFSHPDILKIVEEYKSGYDAVVLNCCADPALIAAREITEIPVIGPMESSMLLSLSLGHKFAVISTSRNSEPWLELQVRNLGIESRLAGVSHIDISVPELESDIAKTAQSLLKTAETLINKKGAEVIILGCTAMSAPIEILRKELNVPVIEPLEAALKSAEVLIDLNLSHAKNGLYMEPDKSVIGGY